MLTLKEVLFFNGGGGDRRMIGQHIGLPFVDDRQQAIRPNFLEQADRTSLKKNEELSV